MLFRLVFIAGFGLTGVWVLLRGLKSTWQHRNPVRWAVGVMTMGLVLIVTPPVLVALRNQDLEMVWIPLILGPPAIFGWGFQQAKRADRWFW